MNLDQWARVPLISWTTPVHELPRLSERVGHRLLVKRDDLTGLAGGGNKARKLEYLVQEAMSAGADCLVTVGAVQSNHARMTAAAARLYGMTCELVLEGDPPPTAVGNLLYDRILGAEVTFCPVGTGDQMLDEVAERLRRQGRRPFVIPVGGSTAVGVLGYVRAIRELADQVSDLPSLAIMCATGSGGTQAGMVLGASLFLPRARVVGISVSRDRRESEQKVFDLAVQAAELLSVSAPDRDLVEVDDRFVGSGYGAVTDECLDALRLAARSEALLLDPVYTAKAMAGVLARAGDEPDPVLFWHTGGCPALGAHPCLENL